MFIKNYQLIVHFFVAKNVDELKKNLTMREIKFRGISIVEDKWVYGSLLTNKDGTEPRICVQTIEKDLVTENILKFVHLNTVGQFTGLRDKNGKEIYEGDIIVHASGSSIMYIVEWHNTELVGKQIGSSSYAGISYWIDTTEVIGNIYDNPELLKGGAHENT